MRNDDLHVDLKNRSRANRRWRERDRASRARRIDLTSHAVATSRPVTEALPSASAPRSPVEMSLQAGCDREESSPCNCVGPYQARWQIEPKTESCKGGGMSTLAEPQPAENLDLATCDTSELAAVLKSRAQRSRRRRRGASALVGRAPHVE